MAVAVDVDVVGAVVSDPSHEDVSASPDLAHQICYLRR
jgi:hypothetical protein